MEWILDVGLGTDGLLISYILAQPQDNPANCFREDNGKCLR